MRQLTALVGLTTALLLSACGGEEQESGSESSALPDLPACEDVWIVGQKLPETYQGCIDRTGEGVASKYINCGGGAGWGDEFLYWHEDGPLSYVAWSAEKHDYPVEWDIEDGGEIGKASGEPLLNTALDTCRGS